MRAACASLVVLVFVTGLLFGGGCSFGSKTGLSSDYPLERARAVVRLAEAGDRAAVYRLVDLLEDQDRAVRMYSILALERLCGDTFGYRYYQPESKRTEAVRRWRAALRDGEVVVRAPDSRADGGITGPGAAGEATSDAGPRDESTP